MQIIIDNLYRRRSISPSLINPNFLISSETTKVTRAGRIKCITIISTATTGTARFDIVGDHTFDTALKAVKELYETETTKIVTITDLVLNDYLYGMPESDFIKMAKILPPRNTTKVGEEND